MSRRSLAPAVALALALAAATVTRDVRDPGPGPAAASRVVEVRMLDRAGIYRFEPSVVTVRRGDVVRFVLVGTVPHNVTFVRGASPAGADLGSRWIGPYLMAAGDAYELPIDDRFADGTYDYVCSPHAPLGMTGRLVVQGATARR